MIWNSLGKAESFKPQRVHLHKYRALRSHCISSSHYKSKTQRRKPANSIKATMNPAPLLTVGHKCACLKILHCCSQRQFSTQMYLQNFNVPFVLDGTNFASFLHSLVTSPFYLKMQEYSLRWPILWKGKNKFYQIKGKEKMHIGHSPLSNVGILKLHYLHILRQIGENHSYLL